MNNRELAKIFKEDQFDRLPGKRWSNERFYAAVKKRDFNRRSMVLKLISENKVETGTDYYRAGMIFQHGSKAADYLFANKLAKKGAGLGNLKAKWLTAASWDRYLMKIGRKYQKYGTQFLWNKNSRSWSLYPVNPKTTDAERRKFGVPELKKQIVKAKKFPSY